MKINNSLLYDIFNTSCISRLNRNIYSTGITVDNDIQNDLTENLAELFLANSKCPDNEIERLYCMNAYLNPPYTQITALSMNTVFDLKKINLAQAKVLDMRLSDAISKRKSVRSYKNHLISYEDISTILFSSSGITHYIKDSDCERPQRACASAGGLYPVKLYFYAHRVKDIPPAVYLYDPFNNQIILINESEDELNKMIDALNENSFLSSSDCRFILFFTMIGRRSIAKYGVNGLKFSYLEIGQIAQNSQLAAIALKIGSCPYAGFSNMTMNRILHIDGDFESFQHAIIFGTESE